MLLDPLSKPNLELQVALFFCPLFGILRSQLLDLLGDVYGDFALRRCNILQELLCGMLLFL